MARHLEIERKFLVKRPPGWKRDASSHIVLLRRETVGLQQSLGRVLANLAGRKEALRPAR